MQGDERRRERRQAGWRTPHSRAAATGRLRRLQAAPSYASILEHRKQLFGLVVELDRIMGWQLGNRRRRCGHCRRICFCLRQEGWRLRHPGRLLYRPGCLLPHGRRWLLQQAAAKSGAAARAGPGGGCPASPPCGCAGQATCCSVGAACGCGGCGLALPPAPAKSSAAVRGGPGGGERPRLRLETRPERRLLVFRLPPSSLAPAPAPGKCALQRPCGAPRAVAAGWRCRCRHTVARHPGAGPAAAALPRPPAAPWAPAAAAGWRTKTA